MAFASESYPGNGTNRLFGVPFPFILRAHVKVYLGYDVATGTGTELAEGPGFSWVTDTQIRTTVAPAEGATTTIIRKTPNGSQLVAWAPGSPPTPEELNTADLQSLYVVQELADLSNAALATSNQAVATVATALPYEPIDTVALIPMSPTPGKRIEVLNSTGIQSFSPLAGMPAGFIGSTGLPVKLVWFAPGNTWQWVSYSPIDPDGRYAPIGTVGTYPRVTASFTTASLAQSEAADFTMNLGKLAELVSVQVSEASWVRLYRSSAQRAADPRLAPGGPLQTIIDLGDNKPYSENVTTTPGQAIIQNPAPLLQGNSAGLVFARLIKQSAGSSAVTLTITTLPLEL